VPSFLFQLAFDPQFASPICGSRTTPLYTAERLYAFFSLFLHVSAPIFDFFLRAPRLNSVASLAQSVAAMRPDAEFAHAFYAPLCADTFKILRRILRLPAPTFTPPS